MRGVPRWLHSSRISNIRASPFLTHFLKIGEVPLCMTRIRNVPIASNHLGESNILSLPSVAGFCVPYCVWKAPSHVLIIICVRLLGGSCKPSIKNVSDNVVCCSQ